MALLFGLSPDAVVADNEGNILPNVTGKVYSDLAASTPLTGTYSYVGTTAPGPTTSGVVTSDVNGRVAIWCDTTSSVYIKWDGDSKVYPLQPTSLTDQIDALYSDVMSDLSDVVEQADAATAVASAAQSAVSAVDVKAEAALAAVGNLSLNVGRYATDGQLNGTEDAVTAFQTAVNVLAANGGGRLVVPSGSVFWFSGVAPGCVNLKSNIELDLRGSTIKKLDDTGYYTIFTMNTGVTNVTIRNGYFRGYLASGGNLCVVSGNRSSNLLVENCQFDGCQGGGHTFDLCGMDSVTFRDCIWRGFDDTVANTEHCEAIECDVSYQGAVSTADPAGYDGSVTKNVTLDNCQFLPFKDPTTNITYPAPIPIGAHTYIEGKYYENIRVNNVTVVDPYKNKVNGGVLQNNANPIGLIHFSSVKGLRVSGMRVVATDGLGCNRVVMVASRSQGLPATGNYGNTLSQVTFASAQGCEDIIIEGLDVRGMNGTTATLDNIVVACGSEAAIDNVRIDMSADGCNKQIVQLYGVNHATVNGNFQNTPSVAVRLVNCRRVTVTGNVAQCAYGVSVDGTNYVSVGPLTAVKTGTASNGVILSQTTTTGTASNYVSATGVIASGYTNIIYNPTTTAIANKIVAGSIPSA